jgi:tRNA 2-thiocytidine biosynthesis protein TtcA
MIDDGNKILVAVSGGKDSMSLLKVLRYKQTRIPIRFNIVACYVDMGLDDDRRLLMEDYFKNEGFDYTIEEAGDWQRSRKEEKTGIYDKVSDEVIMNCFWCSFSRRRILFETANRLGCDKIALGHHKDDIAETFLLNVFFHGEISTMMPKQSLFNGKLHIIRPLALCEERFITRYAKESYFPQFHTKCPRSDTSKRKLMKDVLFGLSKSNPDIKTNIFRCMNRIKFDYIPAQPDPVPQARKEYIYGEAKKIR